MNPDVVPAVVAELNALTGPWAYIPAVVALLILCLAFAKVMLVPFRYMLLFLLVAALTMFAPSLLPTWGDVDVSAERRAP